MMKMEEREMKRKLALLLVFVLVAAVLTGCASDGSKYKKAAKLMEEGNYAEAVQIYEELGDYEDSAELLADAQAKLMRQQYADVFDALCADDGVWYCNGGTDGDVTNSVLRLTFSEDEVAVDAAFIDGNGIHASDTETSAYTVDDSNITFNAKGETYVFPYAMNGSELTINDGACLRYADVEAGLQGYWGSYSMNYIAALSVTTRQANYVYIHDGQIESESASKALNGGPGEYYYYGPYEGSYTLGVGGFDTDMDHGNEFFFTIVNGELSVMHYTSVLEPADGLPGEDGYSF